MLFLFSKFSRILVFVSMTAGNANTTPQLAIQYQTHTPKDQNPTFH